MHFKVICSDLHQDVCNFIDVEQGKNQSVQMAGAVAFVKDSRKILISIQQKQSVTLNSLPQPVSIGLWRLSVRRRVSVVTTRWLQMGGRHRRWLAGDLAMSMR